MNQLFANVFISRRQGDGLELSYETQEAIPAGYESLYSEKDGKFVLTGVKGIKTDADVIRLQTALTKERNDHKVVKDQLRTITEHGTIEEIVTKLDSIPELEAKAGKGSPEDIEKIVTARLTPLQRQLKTLEDEKAALLGENTNFKQEKVTNTIRTEITKAATKLKLKPGAIEDAVVLGERLMTIDDAGNVVTKDGVGVTPYAAPTEWLTEVLPNKGHWLEESFGGGSNGGKGGDHTANPYSHDNWSITDQMTIYKKDPAKAIQMAKRFGVDPLNPVRPAKKA